jgi:hypothetical protein
VVYNHNGIYSTLKSHLNAQKSHFLPPQKAILKTPFSSYFDSDLLPLATASSLTFWNPLALASSTDLAVFGGAADSASSKT